MSEEKVVLSQPQPKASIILTPKRWGGVVGQLLGPLGGTEWLRQAGDMKVPVDTPIKLEELTITDKNSVLGKSYRTGLRSKTKKVMRLPLQYVKEVVGKKRLNIRLIDVNFVVPRGEEKPFEFQVRLTRLKDTDAWLGSWTVRSIDLP